MRVLGAAEMLTRLLHRFSFPLLLFKTLMEAQMILAETKKKNTKSSQPLHMKRATFEE